MTLAVLLVGLFMALFAPKQPEPDISLKPDVTADSSRSRPEARGDPEKLNRKESDHPSEHAGQNDERMGNLIDRRVAGNPDSRSENIPAIRNGADGGGRTRTGSPEGF